MHKKKLSEKAIPVLFDVVVYGGFVAFLVATYIAFQTLVERFPGPVSKLMGVLHNFLA
ncbi:hypothetical protein [Maridesulfovibrio hydrothermalis]|uniref:Uncharacterized protein n=1 Tax=Maridesulfovibrio hydrothermalis AM13 = DSM 14728 TaxID=1121451 RepID=L0R6T4_9BACT|nr:hypothetical protein [Maridesulfovibrio hydrothermalis]CCO22418.1 conserved protein of unknown function [Maridesulfovibrio hydrothermalis AM13 = DSM 14728]